MKFRIPTNQAKKVLGLLNKITARFDFNNIADNILFEIKGDKLIIRATNELAHAKAEFIGISDTKLLDTRFLVPANELINVIKFATSDEIKFTLDAINAEEGKGKLIIEEESKAVIPLKGLTQFPRFPETNAEFKPVPDEDTFINKLSLLSKFTDNEATNYLSGISYNKDTMIANKKISSLIFKNDIELNTDIILPTDILKTIKQLSNLKINSNDFFNAVGKLEDVKVTMSYHLINDEYPIDRIDKAIKKWLNQEYTPIHLSLSHLYDIKRRLNHLITQQEDNIRMTVLPDEITVEYEYNNFSFERSIQEDNKEPLKMKMAYNRLEEIYEVSDAFDKESIDIRLLPSNILFIKEDEYLYMGGILESQKIERDM